MVHWVKIRKAVDSLGLGKILISASLDMPDEYRAITAKVFSGEGFIILLNLSENKTEEAVIESLAHELSHIALNSPNHSAEFKMKMEEIKNFLKEKILNNKKGGF